MIVLKNRVQLDKMRAAGDVAVMAMKNVAAAIRPGITTQELDRIAYDTIIKAGAKPNFLGYGGFPASICASVNEQVVHGIPGKRKLKEGDIVSVDLGAVLKGYHSDMARTFPVGEVDPKVLDLIRVTRESYYKGVEAAVAGNHIGDISEAIESYIQPYGYGIVKALVGHGIGTDMHESPDVPNYYIRRGPLLKPGMTLAIEPMVNLGTWEVVEGGDGWTWSAADGLPSSHYENTIAVTEGEAETLTLWEDETF